MMAETDTSLSFAVKLATSYVGNNKVALDQVPALITSLHEALSKLESGEEIREPAVPINKSVKLLNRVRPCLRTPPMPYRLLKLAEVGA